MQVRFDALNYQNDTNKAKQGKKVKVLTTWTQVNKGTEPLNTVYYNDQEFEQE